MTKAAVMVIATLFSALLGSCGTRTSIGRGLDGGGGIGSGGTGGGGTVGDGAADGGGAACGADSGGRAWSQQPTTPSFAATNYPVAGPSTDAALGDLDGDGKLDMAVLTAEGLSVLLNHGDGTFALLGVNQGAGPYVIALGDVSGDGKPDVVTVSGGVSVLRNQGNGVFAPPIQYAIGNGPNSVALGDLNGDGRIDIAAANGGSQSGDPGDVGVLLNTGDGTFVAANYPAGPNPASVVLGDVNGDCRLDLAVVNVAAGVNVLLGKGDGTFGPATAYAAGTNPYRVVLGDLNGDGRADLALIGAGHVSVVLNIGNGRFGAAVNYPVTADHNPNSIAMGDLNGDGRRDLIVAFQAQPNFSKLGGLDVFLNQEAGTFAAPVHYPVDDSRGDGVWPLTVSIGDMNGDGKDDIVSATAMSGAEPMNLVAVRLNTSP